MGLNLQNIGSALYGRPLGPKAGGSPLACHSAPTACVLHTASLMILKSCKRNTALACR